MSVLYVVSDQPGAGKTALSVTLANELNRRSVSAAAFKPFASAEKNGSDTDAEIFHRLLGQPTNGGYLKAPKKSLTANMLGKVKSTAAEALQECDVLLVEGSAAISNEASIQLAEALDARVLVVATYRPTLDASELASWQAAYGERLLGFVVNKRTLYRSTDAGTRLVPSMAAAGLPCLGVIPEERMLLALTVGDVASHLDGRFVAGEELTDGLVEHFMVGGLGMDPGDLYFRTRENKAVVIRGDRPDVQMSALTTPTKCMLLTQGIEPIEYVKYEAELEEVPLVVVEPDTLTTMDLLNTLQDGAQFDHPAKVERLAQLLTEHVDLPAVYAGLGLAA